MSFLFSVKISRVSCKCCCDFVNTSASSEDSDKYAHPCSPLTYPAELAIVMIGPRAANGSGENAHSLLTDTISIEHSCTGQIRESS